MTFTVTEGGQPLPGAKVNEKDFTQLTVNDSPTANTKVEGSHATYSKGQVGDSLSVVFDNAGSKAANAAIKTDETTKAYKEVNKQSLTIITPNGTQCSCSSTRTISNVVSDGNGSAQWTIKIDNPPTQPKPVKPEGQ